MKAKISSLIVVIAALALNANAAANAQALPKSYAVMSLVGNAIHMYGVRPAVGTRTEAETRSVLAITEQVLDIAALESANKAIKQAQPGATVVLMMTQDAGLYKAQNAMFDAPDANQDNRDYLISLLKERGVSHLLLITKQRDFAQFQLANGAAGTGQLEGLGFYIDDTTEFRTLNTMESSSGMVGPFAYLKVRLLDARTLALVSQAKANKSVIISPPSAKSRAIDVWTSMPNAKKMDYLKGLLDEAVDEAIAPLLTK